MFIEPKFRRLMLDMPEVVRRSLLSDHEIKLCRYVVAQGIVTSRTVADRFDSSTQTIGTALFRLVRKGYLTRKSIADPTGGNIFEYRSAIDATPNVPANDERLTFLRERNAEVYFDNSFDGGYRVRVGLRVISGENYHLTDAAAVDHAIYLSKK